MNVQLWIRGQKSIAIEIKDEKRPVILLLHGQAYLYKGTIKSVPQYHLTSCHNIPDRPPSFFARELEHWLCRNELFTDSKIWMKEQWQKRNEKYGNDSDLTLTAEGGGSLNRVFNYGIGVDQPIRAEFERFVKAGGYTYEQGYSWTWHFKRKESS